MNALSKFVQALSGADHNRILRSDVPAPIINEAQRLKYGELIRVLRNERRKLAGPPFNLLDGDNAATAAAAFAAAMHPVVMPTLVELNKLMGKCMRAMKERGVMAEIDARHAQLAPTHNEGMALWATWDLGMRTKVQRVFADANKTAELDEFVNRPIAPVAPPTLVTRMNDAKKAKEALDQIDVGAIKAGGWQPTDTDKLRAFLTALDAQFPTQVRSASETAQAAAHWH
jgi:hypothetical protein